MAFCANALDAESKDANTKARNLCILLSSSWPPCPFRKRYPEINLDYTRFKFPVLASKFPVPSQKFPVPLSGGYSDSGESRPLLTIGQDCVDL